jgi:hypothetical protein
MGVHDHVVLSSPMNVLSIWGWYLLYLGDFGRQSTSERSISGSSSSPDATLNSPLTRPAPGIMQMAACPPSRAVTQVEGSGRTAAWSIRTRLRGR